MNESLYAKIANLLATLPNAHDEQARRALMLNAGLPDHFIAQVDATGTTATFWPNFVEKLGKYGNIANGESTLIAVLLEARKAVGADKKEEYKTLISELENAAGQFPFAGATAEAYQRYRDDIKQQYGTMKILTMHRPMPMEGFFTQVNLLSKPAAFRRHPKEIERLQEVFVGKNSFGEAIEKGQDGLQAVREHSRLFILGKPGAGKTTFLKYVALRAAAGTLDPDAPLVPMLIFLRDLHRRNLSLFDFIVHEFERSDFPDARAFVTTQLKEGRALLLFDGLDEVNVDQAERQRVIDEIKDFSQTYGQSRIVVTCRAAAEEYHFTDFIYVEMADFEPEQVEAFVRHWFDNTPNAETRLAGTPEEHAARFFKEFERSKRLQDLAKSPLLLTLLCIGFEEAQSFPDRRSEIYKEALDVLLRQWDKSRGISRDPRYQALSQDRKHQMFARIAAETFERGEYLWPLEQIGGRVADFLRRLPNAYPHDETRGADVVKTIEAQHGVFVERAHDIYSFAHLTFQEYYAARYLVEHPAAFPNLIANHAHEERWNEVFLLTTEMLADADDLFAVWLNALDDMARKSDRLTRLLKLVEAQAPNMQLDEEEADEKFRTAYASYMSLQRRAMTMCLRTMSATSISTFAIPTLVNAGDAFAAAMTISYIDALAIATTSADAAAALAITVNVTIDADAAKRLEKAIRCSQKQGLTALAAELQTVKLPKNKRNKKVWKTASQQLLTIFRAHFPAAEYELTQKEVLQVAPYLQSTALLLRCLQNACVSNRAAIEDRLLRASVASG